MINRVLIRIKVVQMLYSYLLTRNEFKIQPSPGPEATRDARFAYRLYLDLMMLVIELSGRKGGSHAPAMMGALGRNRFLSSSPVAIALHLDERIRLATHETQGDMPAFDAALAAIFAAFESSEEFQAYTRKRDHSLALDVDFWSRALTNIISKSPEFLEAARSLPDFTLTGYGRAFDMLRATIASYSDNREGLAKANGDLETSLTHAYNLYNSLLMLAVRLTDLQERRLEAAKEKYMPTEADLYPDTRFIDNGLIKALRANPQLIAYGKDNAIDWLDEDSDTLRLLLNAILESDIYRKYMAEPVTTWAGDCALWRDLFKKVILPSDTLLEALESKSIFWNDDLEIMGTFVIKSIKHFAASEEEGRDVKLLPEYKDEEDRRFGPALFANAVSHREEYRGLIDRFINADQWDSERLAFMDIVVMITAIAELLTFPAIPVAVTLNEYIEIANSYSTPRSGHFINGVLYSVINCLKAEDRLEKTIPTKK